MLDFDCMVFIKSIYLNFDIATYVHINIGYTATTADRLLQIRMGRTGKQIDILPYLNTRCLCVKVIYYNTLVSHGSYVAY